MGEAEPPAVDARDRAFMRRALDLARLGWGQTAPNPMVGAVVVRGGVVVGEGHHARYGGDHAEVAALRAAGPLARGSTVYVTLDVGVEEQAARELNAPFFHAFRSERPWITLKLALSIDGAITDATRSVGWLTGPQARREVHRLRAGSDAIAIGSGTALADDPELTVRDVPPPRLPPRRVVFDSRLRLPVSSRLARTARDVPTTVVSTQASDAAAGERVRALEAAGVHVLAAGSLADALRALRSAGVRSMLVEGGATLAGSLLADGAVDRLIIFQAPVLLGAGSLNAFAGAPGQRPPSINRLTVIERAAFGDDLMTVYGLSPA
jgi:diaminohydroxyphosphoribosylaminopyrimidine deaminase/5-amino-6-(5-phosphoribosylamino)uracil reductase